MNPLLSELNVSANVDVKHTLDRFMNNEEIYLKFLYRFPAEDQFVQLKELVHNKKFDDKTLAVAHSLKGLTANLGMNTIYETTNQIMFNIKMGELDNIDPLFDKLENNYNTIISAIHKYEPSTVK